MQVGRVVRDHSLEQLVDRLRAGVRNERHGAPIGTPRAALESNYPFSDSPIVGDAIHSESLERG